MSAPAGLEGRPDRPLRVVHVVRQFAPAVGGLEEAVLKLCLALKARGTEASVVTLDRVTGQKPSPLPSSDVVRGIAVTRIPFSGSKRYPLAPRVLAQVGPADVVHVHAIDFFFDFLAWTKPLHRKPLVASTHGGFFHTEFARRLKHIYFQTVTRTSSLAYSAICASSFSDFDLFRPIAKQNLTLVENGVDIEKWAEQAPIAPDRSMIAIGRFASHKQLPTLFPLLHSLRQLHPAWRLTIAGRPWDVTQYDLRRAAEVAGVSAAVEILTDPEDAEIGEAIRRSSYIVSASRHEGFGLGVVEGMAAGLTPVLNDIRPFRDLIARSGCGQLITVGRPEAAAREVEALHRRHLDRRGPLRAEAIQAAGRYSWSSASTLFMDHYRAALMPQTKGRHALSRKEGPC